jgi:hypothetical protein
VSAAFDNARRRRSSDGIERLALMRKLDRVDPTYKQ